MLSIKSKKDENEKVPIEVPTAIVDEDFVTAKAMVTKFSSSLDVLSKLEIVLDVGRWTRNATSALRESTESSSAIARATWKVTTATSMQSKSSAGYFTRWSNGSMNFPWRRWISHHLRALRFELQGMCHFVEMTRAQERENLDAVKNRFPINSFWFYAGGFSTFSLHFQDNRHFNMREVTSQDKSTIVPPRQVVAGSSWEQESNTDESRDDITLSPVLSFSPEYPLSTRFSYTTGFIPNSPTTPEVIVLTPRAIVYRPVSRAVSSRSVVPLLIEQCSSDEESYFLFFHFFHCIFNIIQLFRSSGAEYM